MKSITLRDIRRRERIRRKARAVINRVSTRWCRRFLREVGFCVCEVKILSVHWEPEA